MNCEEANVQNEDIPVLWNGDIYKKGRNPYNQFENTLWKYSLSRNSWDEFPIPFSDSSEKYILATYHSKLLLIGGCGVQTSDKDWCGTVWEFSDTDITFKESLYIKPVPIPDDINKYGWSICADSEDDYLVVVIAGRSRFSVMVFDGKSWTVRDGGLRSSHYAIQVIVRNHTVFLCERGSALYIANVYKAPLQSLLTEVSNSSSNELSMWQTLKSTHKSRKSIDGDSNVVILGNHLVMASSFQKDLHIYGYFIGDEASELEWCQWVDMGNSSERFDLPPRIVGLPDGTLLVVGKMVEPPFESGQSEQDKSKSKFDILKVQPQGIDTYYIHK